MKIGLDISSLQGPHRMRGIGYTLINFINNIPGELRQKHSFVFYYYTEVGHDNPLDILDLNDLKYEVRSLQHIKQSVRLRLPGKLNVLARIANKFISGVKQSSGDARITDTKDIDVFLQTDQMVALPAGKDFKKAFIAYDLIPYVLEWDYLWNYATARRHGLPIQASIRCSGRRWLYLHKLSANVKMADRVLAISDATKQDFVKYMPEAKSKIVTTPLGVNLPKSFNGTTPVMTHYIPSSWGYLQRPYIFDSSTDFLLFVGGADKRRKLDELVTAFNHLRGQGHDIKLVLAGDSMKGPKNISTEIIQKSLLESSYLDDIIFMGFVSDEQRDWLYKNALAFVFPSKYEGFGLPVLEAFSYGTPVISYPNTATVEVAGDTAKYADGDIGLIYEIKQLFTLNGSDGSKSQAKRKAQVQKYSWQKTSSQIINELESVL